MARNPENLDPHSENLAMTLFLSYFLFEVKNENSTYIESLKICPRVNIRRNKSKFCLTVPLHNMPKGFFYDERLRQPKDTKGGSTEMYSAHKQPDVRSSNLQQF